MSSLFPNDNKKKKTIFPDLQVAFGDTPSSAYLKLLLTVRMRIKRSVWVFFFLGNFISHDVQICSLGQIHAEKKSTIIKKKKKSRYLYRK